MRSKLSRNTIFIVVFVYFIIGMVFMFQIPDHINLNQSLSYGYILFSYYLIGFIWIKFIDKYGFYIFEPVNMVMLLTFISFSIEPMVSIIQDDMGIGSFYVFDGCFKATSIYMIGIILFLCAYYNGSLPDVYTSYRVKKIEPNDSIKYCAFGFWCLSFVVQLLDMMSNGYSISYIFSFGSSGSIADVENGGLGIFGNMRYFSLVSLLYLDVYAKNKKSVWVLRILSLLLFALRGYRWIVVIFLLSPIVFNSYINRKAPRKQTIAILGIVLIFIVGGLQFVRVSLRAGNGLSVVGGPEFNLAYIWRAFQGNFDLYKTLYAAVTYFPEQQFYTLGQQMILLTIATIIPRSIWPTKPYSVIEKVHKIHFMGEGAVRGAWAYAQLTEFYIEFGIIGVCLCMIILGRICNYIYKVGSRQNRTIHGAIVAAFMFGMLMQFVIRGYMPLNFWPTMFMLIPVFFIKNFVCKSAEA